MQLEKPGPQDPLVRNNVSVTMRTQCGGLTKRALFCLRLQHELAPDAAPLSVVSLRMRRAAARLSIRNYAPLALARLRDGKRLSGRRQGGLGHSL